MFWPRRPASGISAWVALAMFRLLGIVGLLVSAGSFSISRTESWAVRQALAQSDTATPGASPQPDVQPTPSNPTAGLGEPPLTLRSSASVASAGAGEQFNFTATVGSGSEEPRAVELRANIDGQLELLSASASGGSCSGGATLVCKFSVRRGQSATVVAAVRVRSSAPPNGHITYQALVQDDLSNTAASDQVVVTIAASVAQPAPIATPDSVNPADDGSPPQRPTSSVSRPATAATSAPAGDSGQVARNPTSPPASVPVSFPTLVASIPATILIPPAGGAAGLAPDQGAQPGGSWLALAPTAAVQALDPAAQALWAPAPEDAPPVAASAAPAAPPAPQPNLARQRQLVLLPKTAAAPPAAGYVAGLLGFALVIHGLRRVRRAAAQLDRESAALGRLAALLDAAARRRARMAQGDRSRSDERQGTIDDRRSRHRPSSIVHRLS